MPREHLLKIAPEFFREAKSDRKSAEIRLDDRLYMEGETVYLQEYNIHLPESERFGETIGPFVITHVLRRFVGLAPGYVCLSLTRTEYPYMLTESLG